MNGWSNRETWVTNLHFMDYLQEITEEYLANNSGGVSDRTELISNLAEYLEQSIVDVYADQIRMIEQDHFLADLWSFSRIDWVELAIHYSEDLLGDVETDKEEEAE